MLKNKFVSLRDYVEFGEVPLDAFVVNTEEVDMTELPPGTVVLKIMYVSVDPYLRGRMRNQKGYFVGPFTIGKPLESSGVGKVIYSSSELAKVGEIVSAMLPWSEHMVIRPDVVPHIFRPESKIQPQSGVNLSYYTGILGMPGATAFLSLHKFAEHKLHSGNVAFVSGGAGAVGSLVVQLCHRAGMTVIATAGRDDKVAFLRKLGAIAENYKKISAAEVLSRHAPGGIDLYFDNVGGETLDAALAACKNYAVVLACGMISMYDTQAAYAYKNMFMLVTKRLTVNGFIAGDWLQDPDMMSLFRNEITPLVQDGIVTIPESVTHGIENAGKAFVSMMRGDNLGKAVVEIFAD